MELASNVPILIKCPNSESSRPTLGFECRITKTRPWGNICIQESGCIGRALKFKRRGIGDWESESRTAEATRIRGYRISLGIGS